MLSTVTRRKLELIISRISEGEEVSFQERVELHKFSLRYPMIAGKISQALERGEKLV